MRIFAGTTMVEKVYSYILFSLAFTYVLDNAPAIIKPGVTIKNVVDTAFGKFWHQALADELTSFHEMRKAKFNRTKIYPDLDLPFLKTLK